MGRRIVFENPTAPAITAPTRRERSELSEKTRAAITHSTAIFAGLSVIVVATAAILRLDEIYVAYGVAGSAAIALLRGAWVTSRWAQECAIREWEIEDLGRVRRESIEDEERERRHRFEDEERLAMAQSLEHVTAPDDAPGHDLGYVNALAWIVFHRAHLGLSTSRDDMVSERICTQAQWNTVNRILVVTRIKRGYTVQLEDSIAETWAIWLEHVRIEDDGIWAKQGRGQWRVLEI